MLSFGDGDEDTKLVERHSIHSYDLQRTFSEPDASRTSIRHRAMDVHLANARRGRPKTTKNSVCAVRTRPCQPAISIGRTRDSLQIATTDDAVSRLIAGHCDDSTCTCTGVLRFPTLPGAITR